jgi:hypothetical protein
LAIEAPDILEIEQVCDFASTRLEQISEAVTTGDEEPLGEWEANCLPKVRAWLKSLKDADQMDRVKLALDTLKAEGALFWVDDDAGMELDAILHISTAHIHEDTAARLDGTVKGNEHRIPGLTVFEKNDYGWFIHTHIGEEGSKHVPDELDVILQWCVDNGIVWLCLDRDAMEHPEFSKFDW